VAIPISYNGETPMCEEDWSPTTFAARFFWRVLHSLHVSAGVTRKPLADFVSETWEQHGIDPSNADAVREIINRSYALDKVRVVVCADEFSKPYGMLEERCQELHPGSAWEKELRSQMSKITSSGWDFVLCGFEPSFIDDIRSSSGRATTTYFLPLVGPEERQQYNPLHTALIDEYRRKAAPFPVYIYEVVKSSPGLLGRWLELATVKGALPARLSDLRDDVPWYRCIEYERAELVPLADGYLAAWAAAPYSTTVEEKIRGMAEHSVPLAIATNNGASVPHAFPFAVLCGALDSGYTGLLRHVRAAHAAVREYCEGVAAYSPDSP
jgi:hypothetical protein